MAQQGGDSDLDDFLYGAEEKPSSNKEDSVENASAEKEQADEESEEESDEDDVEIVLDKADDLMAVDAAKRSAPAIESNTGKVIIQEETSQFGNVQKLDTMKGTVNIDGIGEWDGHSILDLDLEFSEDKPWRKPGADITDYFNYGFNEYIWKNYCLKQKQLRDEKTLRSKISTFESAPAFRGGNPYPGGPPPMGFRMPAHMMGRDSPENGPPDGPPGDFYQQYQPPPMYPPGGPEFWPPGPEGFRGDGGRPGPAYDDRRGGFRDSGRGGGFRGDGGRGFDRRDDRRSYDRRDELRRDREDAVDDSIDGSKDRSKRRREDSTDSRDRRRNMDRDDRRRR